MKLYGYVYSFGTFDPIEGVDVNLSQVGPPRTNHSSIRTDAKGYFEFDIKGDLGQVLLVADHAEYCSQTHIFTLGLNRNRAEDFVLRLRADQGQCM
ncbi:MAG: hypothetical protein H6603_07735 [Flavobacteriales bacterium]|nr:hypothetical protein [Flavobacteriales bacterium]MCB9204854.1 hypothetical protein [Flavobacteriales bacterium]